MFVYLTDHAYARVCERLNTTLSKAEIVDTMNRSMSEAVITGEYVLISGHNINLRLVKHNEKAVCVTVFRIFIPIYSHKKPLLKHVRLHWVDSQELKGADIEPDADYIRNIEEAAEAV